MKRAWMVVLLPLAAACGKTPTQPTQSLYMPAPSKAVVFAGREDLTGQALYAGACGLPDLTVTKGSEWYRENTTFNKNTQHLSITYAFSGVQAVTSAGVHYQVVGRSAETLNVNVTGTPAEASASYRVRLIGAGTAVNATILQTAHITINANGTTTVYFTHFGTTCS